MVLSNAFNPDPRVYKEARSLVEHEFTDVIKILKENKELKEHISKNARRLAEDLFSLNHARRQKKSYMYSSSSLLVCKTN